MGPQGPQERVHRGWRLRLLYPLRPLARVPAPVRRAGRRRATGAAVAVHRRVRHRARVVAVTGTAGKTTTKDLLGHMLAAAGPTLVTHDNDNGVYGVPATVLAIGPRDRFAVVEAGLRDRPGEMAWFARLIRPDVAVLTGLGDDHVPAYGSRRAVLEEKARLIAAAPVAVLPADDPAIPRSTAAPGARILTAGWSADADVRLLAADVGWEHGLRLRLVAGGAEIGGDVRLYARPLAPLVALAVAAAWALGVRPADALAAAARFRPRDGRLRPVPGPDGSVLVLDEHKSRIPNAVMALGAMAALPATRRIAVLGEMQEVPSTPEAYAPLAGPAAAMDAVLAVGRAAGPLGALLPGAAACAGVDDVVDALEGLRLGRGDVVLLHAATRQHLLRVVPALEGRAFGCRVTRCTLDWRCTACPYLGPGPPGRVVEAP